MDYLVRNVPFSQKACPCHPESMTTADAMVKQKYDKLKSFFIFFE